jgi:hypothetical protein
MIDYRKLLVALVVAILFTIFVQTTIDAVKEGPNYNDFCNESLYRPAPVTQSDVNQSAYQKQVDAWEAERRVCEEQYRDARDNYNFIVFLISSILGVIAVLLGLFIPSIPARSPVCMALVSGLLLGGLLTIFIGTMRGWGGIGRLIRPFVILAELVIVIIVAYLKLNEQKRKKK